MFTLSPPERAYDVVEDGVDGSLGLAPKSLA
jgi:hypothetical protein